MQAQKPNKEVFNTLAQRTGIPADIIEIANLKPERLNQMFNAVAEYRKWNGIQSKAMIAAIGLTVLGGAGSAFFPPLLYVALAGAVASGGALVVATQKMMSANCKNPAGEIREAADDRLREYASKAALKP